MLIDESSTNCKGALIYTGQVSIAKHSGTVKNLITWFECLEPKFRDDIELVELVDRGMSLFSRIPSNRTIQIGYQENRELSGVEMMFSSFKCGLFTVKVNSSESEYYEIDRGIERAANNFHLKGYLFETFKQQFKYRLDYIAKKLGIMNQAQLYVKKSRLSRMTMNSSLINKIERDNNRVVVAEQQEVSKASQLEKEFGMYNIGKAELNLVLLKEKHPEADFPVEPTFSSSALNGRVTVWSKKDLIRFYQKETKQNPSLGGDDMLAHKTAKPASNLDLKRPSNFGKFYSPFNPTPELPFYVRNHSRPATKKTCIQTSWESQPTYHRKTKSLSCNTSADLPTHSSPPPRDHQLPESKHHHRQTSTIYGTSVFMPFKASRSNSLACFARISSINKDIADNHRIDMRKRLKSMTNMM